MEKHVPSPIWENRKRLYWTVTRHINNGNNRLEMQHTYLKEATGGIALLALDLQKPSWQYKAKDHHECFSRRLTWKEGEIDMLLGEGWMMQKHVTKSRKPEPPNRAEIFTKLVMEEQINSALHYLSEDCRGLLPLWCYSGASKDTLYQFYRPSYNWANFAKSSYPTRQRKCRSMADQVFEMWSGE